MTSARLKSISVKKLVGRDVITIVVGHGGPRTYQACYDLACEFAQRSGFYPKPADMSAGMDEYVFLFDEESPLDKLATILNDE
jgi:hypothetical protein